jgi:hypothetical protein
MKKVYHLLSVTLLISLFACGERKHVIVDSGKADSVFVAKKDPLDSLSLAILRYLKMHDISNFIGEPAQAFKDSIPFAASRPSFGWEDATICYIYYKYEGSALTVTIEVMDSPYRFDLDTMRMLDQSPEKMFQYKISSICVSDHLECLVEARNK